MTLPEAVHLVLQAAVLAQGGEALLLDMGEPVSIKVLADQMVRLSGLSLRAAVNPGCDIEIVCTGFRLGEKLYEELLIDAESEAIANPLIYRAREHALPPDRLWPQINTLQAAIERQDGETALAVLEALVHDWQRAHPDAISADR